MLQVLLKNLFRKKSLREQLHLFFNSNNITITNDQQQMMLGVAKLMETDASQIKIPEQRMVAVERNTSLKSLASAFKKSGHSRLPVYEELDGQRKYSGVIYAKDLLPFLIKREGRFKITELLRKIKVVPETQSLLSLLREMRLQKNHIVLTVNEHGDVTGLVTLEDILEEIVGEIRDEFDNESLPIREVGRRKYRVDPIISLEDFNSILALNLPEEDFNTLSGFLLHNLKGNVEAGSSFTHGNTKFVLDKVSGNHIQSTIVEILQDS